MVTVVFTIDTDGIFLLNGFPTFGAFGQSLQLLRLFGIMPEKVSNRIISSVKHYSNSPLMHLMIKCTAVGSTNNTPMMIVVQTYDGSGCLSSMT
jgi:hypothetical protein